MMYIFRYQKKCIKFKVILELFFQDIHNNSPYLSQYGHRIELIYQIIWDHLETFHKTG